jgi:hypothetical protein
MNSTKTKLETTLESILEKGEVMLLEDLLNRDVFDVPKPYFKALGNIPEFDLEVYRQRFADDFSFFFLGDEAKKEFLTKKYEEDIQDLKLKNDAIEEGNSSKIEEWNLQKEQFYAQQNGKNDEIKQMYADYTAGNVDGVAGFFHTALSKMDHTYFQKKNFILSFDEGEKQLNVKFVFPDKQHIFINQDGFSPISSINDERFQAYYLNVLFLLVKNIFSGIVNNDLESVLNELYFEGYVVEKDRDSGKVITKKKIAVQTQVDDETLEMLEAFTPKEFFAQRNVNLSQATPSGSEIHMNALLHSDELKKIIRDTVNDVIREQLGSMKMNLLDYVDSRYETLFEQMKQPETAEKEELSNTKVDVEKMKAVVEPEQSPDEENSDLSKETYYNSLLDEKVEPTETVCPEVTDEESSVESDYQPLFDKIANFGIPQKAVFLKIVKLLPNQVYPIDSLNVDKLKLIRVMSALNYMGRALIKVSGMNSNNVSWGEGYPKPLIDAIVEKYA